MQTQRCIEFVAFSIVKLIIHAARPYLLSIFLHNDYVVRVVPVHAPLVCLSALEDVQKPSLS